MKKFNKIVSTLLAVLMLLSSFSVLTSAAEVSGTKYEKNTDRQTLNYMTGNLLDYDEEGKLIINEGTGEPIYVVDENGDKIVVDTAEERLEYMDLRLEKDGYRLYIDAYSGEVAVENVESGEVLFSNPYDVATTKSADSVKEQLLSQIVVKYTSTTSNEENFFYSFTEAAKREQIDIKNIKNGIRVEYSIGREQSKILLPMMIERTSFEEKILAPLKEALGEDSYDYRKFDAFYVDIFKENYTGDTLDSALSKYPLLKQMDFYMLDGKTSDVDKNRLEQYIKTYVPDYTFDNLDEDHLLTGYVAEDDNPPLFRMALEYTLTEDGLSVRLPANGIRFNETLYRLVSLDILPYMGAAENSGAGYTFFPDGSGTLFDLEKIVDTNASTTVTAKVYGQDFAYHTITGKHQQEIRYPVFGVVDSYEKVIGQEIDEETGDVIKDITETKNRGFVAIVEEGEAMMELSSYHEVRANNYSTVKMTVYPRPQDTYNVADAISVGNNSEWTVVSSRKYTGNYKIKYILLTPDEVAEEKGIKDYYECSYVGMAFAYRDYLIKNGTLTKLTADDVSKDIPLYIETFGTIPTVERFLSIPVNVMTPLTSFEDVQTMYSDLSAKGITNVNFILTGYANGGMYSTVPYGLKWEKAVGGKSGFEELLEYAKKEGFGIYPDFDFAYISSTGLFDGVTLNDHIVKTIDNRYANKREYSATKQTYISYFELAVSPAYYNRFYEKLTSKYLDYEPIGISVSTLGNALNSDFDEDEPYNREDAKKYTMLALEYMADNYASVLASGGNSYTWKYLDHITEVALDSSRYAQAAAAVPFLGIVLHGYVQMAGDPINMEGNLNYALLKSIESGASLKFILSYRNTDNLKDFQDLSQYYSIRYDIWFDDVVSLYSELNSVLASVQTSTIVDHKFVEGTRVPDADELMADAEAAIQEAIKLEEALAQAAGDKERVDFRNARLNIMTNYSALESTVDSLKKAVDTLKNVETTGEGGATVKIARSEELAKLVKDYTEAKAMLDTLNAELEELNKDTSANAAAIKDKNAEIEKQTSACTKALNTAVRFVNDIYRQTDSIVKTLNTLKANAEAAKEAIELLETKEDIIPEFLSELKVKADAIIKAYDANKALLDEVLSFTQTAVFNAVDGKLEGVEKYELPKENTAVENTEEVEEDVVNKYQSDDNKIAYVEYENGVAFLLNFNNYDVKTVYNGTTYTIGSYDYVVIGLAK